MEKETPQLTANKIGAKFNGTKLGVLDEISMISLENLSEMSSRHIDGQLAITESEDERNIIKSKPFGGMHMLFTGDLWQLRTIGGSPIYSLGQLRGDAQKGREIWHALNEYSELTENYRFKNDTSTHLQDFLRGARIGHVDPALLLEVNKRIFLSSDSAVRHCHKDAVWVAHTKSSVSGFNADNFQARIHAGASHFRMVAYHTSSGDLLPSPNEAERKDLYNILKRNGPSTSIDLAIGSRVSCTQNLGTQIGNKDSFWYQFILIPSKNYD